MTRNNKLLGSFGFSTAMGFLGLFEWLCLVVRFSFDEWVCNRNIDIIGNCVGLLWVVVIFYWNRK